jgi:hypothetical protein
MEESKGNEFIQMIRALWNEQKKREILYLEALKKDGMGSSSALWEATHPCGESSFFLARHFNMLRGNCRRMSVCCQFPAQTFYIK